MIDDHSRSRRGARGASKVVVVALLVAAALGLGISTALGLDLTPTPQPLPGSNFQGGDGNQANGQHHIDWEQLQKDGLVVHVRDLGPGPPLGTADDFFGAPGHPSSMELNPGMWSLRTGTLGAPGADILDVYHAFERRNGQAFLYLAMTRFAATGTWFLTFELNQVAEPAFFSNGLPVPCRTNGDLLITFQQTGTDVTKVSVLEWRTATENTTTGCALTGTLENVNGSDGLTAEDVQGAFNSQTIDRFLPGVTTSGHGGVVGAHTIGPRGFMEAAVNLTKVLHLEDEPVCGTEFLSVWAHSRASSQEANHNSDMKDYVRPTTVVEAECPASPTLSTQQHAAISGESTTDTTLPHGTAIWDQATLSGGRAPTGNLIFHLYGPNDTTCAHKPIFTDTVPVTGANGPYNSGSFTPTDPGTYEWRVKYVSGDGNNHDAGPTACGAEPVTVTEQATPPPPPPPPSPAHPSITTSSSPATVAHGGAVGDTAVLSGGDHPTGHIEFRLYGPNDGSCTGPPAFVFRQNVSGNGSYPSPTPVPEISGTYRWVAEFVSSDSSRNADASTRCNDTGESVVVESPFPVPQKPEEPEKPRPKPKPKPKPPKPPKPVVTG